MGRTGFEGVCAAHGENTNQTVAWWVQVEPIGLQPVGQEAGPSLCSASGCPSSSQNPDLVPRTHGHREWLVAQALPSGIHLAWSLLIAFQILVPSRKTLGSAPFSKHLPPCQQAYSHGSVMSS